MRISYGSLDDYWELRGFTGALDWTHGNGATYDSRDDSVIISLRHMAALLKVDRASGDIRWILGEPDDWGPLMTKCIRSANLARWPYHGHNPRLTDHGTIMFFDNGTWGARPPRPPVPVHEKFQPCRGVPCRRSGNDCRRSLGIEPRDVRNGLAGSRYERCSSPAGHWQPHGGLGPTASASSKDKSIAAGTCRERSPTITGCRPCPASSVETGATRSFSNLRCMTRAS